MLWQLIFKTDVSKMGKIISTGAGKWRTPSGISRARERRGRLSLAFPFVKVKFNPLPICRGRLLGCSHYLPLKHFTAARLDFLWLLLFVSLSVFCFHPEIKVWETEETAVLKVPLSQNHLHVLAYNRGLLGILRIMGSVIDGGIRIRDFWVLIILAALWELITPWRKGKEEKKVKV